MRSAALALAVGACSAALLAIAPATTQVLGEVTMDWRVALFAAGCAALSSLAAGLVPALTASDTGLRSTRPRRGSPGRGAGSDGAGRCSSRRPRCPWRCWCREACWFAPTFARRPRRRLRGVGRPDRPTATAAIALCERSRTGRGDGTHLRSHRLDSRSDPLGCDDEPLHPGFAYLTLVDIENRRHATAPATRSSSAASAPTISRPCGFACDRPGVRTG